STAAKPSLLYTPNAGRSWTSPASPAPGSSKSCPAGAWAVSAAPSIFRPRASAAACSWATTTPGACLARRAEPPAPSVRRRHDVVHFARAAHGPGQVRRQHVQLAVGVLAHAQHVGVELEHHLPGPHFAGAVGPLRRHEDTAAPVETLAPVGEHVLTRQLRQRRPPVHVAADDGDARPVGARLLAVPVLDDGVDERLAPGTRGRPFRDDGVGPVRVKPVRAFFDAPAVIAG